MFSGTNDVLLVEQALPEPGLAASGKAVAPAQTPELMRRLKERWDPAGILNPAAQLV